MTKKQALEKIKSDLVKQFPSDYVIGIENDHITIRRIQNSNSIAQLLTQMTGNAQNAKKLLENVKKGFANAVGDKEENEDE